ncbi:MAG: Crp/Fnr family transcriptional regulator [Pseudomonadota bacterium]
MPDLTQKLNNRLLKLLEAADEKALISQMQYVYLPKGEILFKSGQKLSYAYFPTSAIISLIVAPYGMSEVESATISNEGVFGVPLLRDDYLTTRADVQSAGYCYRIETDLLQESIQRSDAFIEILLNYLQLRTSKMAQMAICSREHPIEQQLCRVLLNILDNSHDSNPNSNMAISIQTLSAKLNVLHEDISFHLDKLHRLGVIDLKQGKVIVLNRSFLQGRACACYQIIANETARLSPG